MLLTKSRDFNIHYTDGNNTTTAMTTLRFPGTAALDGMFTSDLRNRNSPAFRELEWNFCNEVKA